MPKLPSRYLGTVVMFEESQSGKLRHVATGFLCHHKNPGSEDGDGLFVVSSASAVRDDLSRTRLVCRSGWFLRSRCFPATGEKGYALGDWLIDPEADVALLPLGRKYLGIGAPDYQALNTDRDALTSSEMRRRRISEGDEVLILGFVPAQPPRFFPASMVRRGIIASTQDLYRTASPMFLAEATIADADLGSPVVMAPAHDARSRRLNNSRYKLVGVVAGHLPNPEGPARRDVDGGTLLVRLGTGLVRVGPVEAVRALMARAIEKTPRPAAERSRAVPSRRPGRHPPSPEYSPYLDTAVLLEGLDANQRRRSAGTGFLCRARGWNGGICEMLFLVTSAHVIPGGLTTVRILFRPREGEVAVSQLVTGKTGMGPTSWFTDPAQDLAALWLEPTQLPADRIRHRSFDVDTDALAIPQIRKHQITEGDDALLVGFVLPRRDGRRETPAVRLARISEIPKRSGPRRPLVLEGTAFPGNSGSPVIVNPGREAGRDGDVGGKLIGILCKAGNAATLVRSDEHGHTTEFQETISLMVLTPVDALRNLLSGAIWSIGFVERYGARLQRVKAWLKGRTTPD